MHRPTTGRRPAAAARPALAASIVALTLTAGALGAQAPDADARERQRGVRLGAALSYGRASLSDAGARVWESVGDVGAGVGAALSLGYDARRVGVTVGFDAAATPVGDRDGTALTFAALAHWRHTGTLGGWYPVVTAGYVRQGLGSVEVAPSELPPGVGQGSDPNNAARRPLSVFGNGARIGLAGERPLTPRAALTVEVTADLVRFGSAGYDEFEYRLRDGGWSTMPRIGVGLRWWPRAR